MDTNNYLASVKKQFQYYKQLGDQTMAQLEDEDLFWQYNEASNSIAVIVKHIAGNMLSRWTDFLTTDGEKAWRDRDEEFVDDLGSTAAVKAYWEKGWAALYNALEQVNEENADTIIYIRKMGHTIPEAINRQMMHYAYHIGQMVYVGRMIRGAMWQSLSIPKGDSKKYNAGKFALEKRKAHFTDEFLEDKK